MTQYMNKKKNFGPIILIGAIAIDFITTVIRNIIIYFISDLLGSVIFTIFNYLTTFISIAVSVGIVVGSYLTLTNFVQKIVKNRIISIIIAVFIALVVSSLLSKVQYILINVISYGTSYLRYFLSIKNILLLVPSVLLEALKSLVGYYGFADIYYYLTGYYYFSIMSIFYVISGFATLITTVLIIVLKGKSQETIQTVPNYNYGSVYDYSKPVSEFVFCPACGSKMGTNNIFCTKCGTKLRRE